MTTHRPIFFFRLFQLYAFLGAIPVAINTVDILLNPTATPLDGNMAYRLITGLVIAPLILVIAVLCVRRVPDNLIGWTLIVFAYGTSWLAVRVELLPLPPMLVISNFFVGLFWMTYLLIPFYFPNGLLFPPRVARWGNGILATLLVSLFGGSMVFSRTIVYGTGENQRSVANPLFIVEIDYTKVSVPLLNVILILGLISVFLRYRSANHVERLQLRWLLVGVIAQFGVLFLSLGLAEVIGLSAQTIGALYTIIMPVAIGFAILRHKLYDIDIIIRRTLIYTVLTTILGVVYFGSIVLTQQVFRAVTGQSSEPAIVVSTLLIAALFAPLRRRVQDVIDRRLYRKKYDAEKVLADFQKNLRDEVDMETLKANLIDVLQDTMQPTKIALWVKGDKAS